MDDNSWDDVGGTGMVHYSILRHMDAMTALRELFPKGEADEMNFVLFSTSGIHGSYLKIEDAERDLGNVTITFLVIQPRLVCMRYGLATPKTHDDIQFLKRIRESSKQAVGRIG